MYKNISFLRKIFNFNFKHVSIKLCNFKRIFLKLIYFYIKLTFKKYLIYIKWKNNNYKNSYQIVDQTLEIHKI